MESDSGGRPEPLTPFERDTLSSATYAEAVGYYRVLAEAYPTLARLDSVGDTDAGLPLLAFTIGGGGEGSPTLLINNGIHAGEPCGVDASMMFARELLAGRLVDTASLAAVRVVVIPAYNVGGMLNRGGNTRANQVGPRAYGFRGNALNLDLNRDFTKRDARNTRALTALIARLSPDIFIDTHTTNGADYAYALTVIPTQAEKLGPVLGPYLRDTVVPALYAGVEAAGYPVSPYVNSDGVPQETGIDAFIEGPRYSTGYAALHHSLAFVTEAHMLKPFAVRVRATGAFLEAALRFWLDHREAIARARDANRAALFAQDSVVLSWALDTTRADTFDFRGYAAVREPSAVTGEERLRYDRSRPETVPTPNRDYARPAITVARPRAYLVPYVYRHLLPTDSGLLPGDVRTLPADTLIAGVAYGIEDFSTVSAPYEGHYLHTGVTVTRRLDTVRTGARDLLVTLTPANARLLTALFEPEAPDGYVAWGFFDSWLQRKEHYSAYVFEETAAQLLRDDAGLREAFGAKKRAEVGFRESGSAQLDWLYARSGMAEGGWRRVPVVGVE